MTRMDKAVLCAIVVMAYLFVVGSKEKDERKV